MNTKSERRHDLDWLRLIAILILLFYHTGMWFNTWGWHVKNNELDQRFEYWMVWLHFWRMPLLLFISGAGTYMALSKRTAGQYARERFTRLFIPLLFGMFVIVPPQIYYEHISEYDSYWSFYKTVFNFVPYPKGSFSWHHLWFVAYLFVYSLIALPFLVFLRSPRADRFRQRTLNTLGTPAGMIFIPAIILFLSQLLLRPYFPDETHDFKDPAFFVGYFLFFLYGMLFYSTPELWSRIGASRKSLLMAALAVLVLFYYCYFSMKGFVPLPASRKVVGTTFDILAIFLSWFTVIAVIGHGQHYLNRSHPWLKYFNEGLYPFYILHQTVIIVLGYYICQLPWSIAAKFTAISLLTLLTCVVLFMYVIRPFKPLRLFFGLKLNNKKSG